VTVACACGGRPVQGVSRRRCGAGVVGLRGVELDEVDECDIVAGLTVKVGGSGVVEGTSSLTTQADHFRIDRPSHHEFSKSGCVTCSTLEHGISSAVDVASRCCPG